MAQLFDESGNKVEALTSEEVDAKLNEVREQTIEEINRLREEEVNDLSAQITAKEEALKVAEETLKKEQDKEKNLGGQRKVIEAKSEEVDALKKQIEGLTGQITELSSKIESKDLQKSVSVMIQSLSGGDKNTADKIKLFYGQFNPIDIKDKTSEQVEEEIKQRVQNAYILATGGTKPVNLLTSAVISSAGGSIPQANPTGEKLSEEGIKAAKELGISDAELKRYKLA